MRDLGFIKELLTVAAGGSVGAVSRYLLAGAVERTFKGSGFPLGTFSVNVLGCLLIGILLGLAEARLELSHQARLFLAIGLLGSLTTFSTFGYETLELLRHGRTGAALLTVAGNLVVGLLAVAGGRWAVGA